MNVHLLYCLDTDMSGKLLKEPLKKTQPNSLPNGNKQVPNRDSHFILGLINVVHEMTRVENASSVAKFGQCKRMCHCVEMSTENLNVSLNFLAIIAIHG